MRKECSDFCNKFYNILNFNLNFEVLYIEQVEKCDNVKQFITNPQIFIKKLVLAISFICKITIQCNEQEEF